MNSTNRTNTLFKGLSIQTIVTIVMGVLEIALFAIMSRLLTKSDFGYYAAISGIMAICMSISEAGLGSAIIQKKDASNTHISTAFTLSCIVGVLFSIIVCILSPYIANIVADETLTNPLQIMSFTILFHSLISVGNAILYRKLNFKRIGINSVLAYLLSGTIGVLMAYKGFGLWAIVTFNVTNSLFILLFLYGFSIKIPRLMIKKGDSKNIISFGGWLTLGVILNNISHQLDKLVLSKWLSVDALGAYNRPAGFVSSISSKINNIFDTVLFPILSNLQDNKSQVRSIFIRGVSLLNSFSVVFASVFFFNAEFIITIFFGKDWMELVPIMQIISLSVIFNIDGRLVDCFFRSLGLVKLSFTLRLISVFLTLLCLYIGAQYNIKGVAWGIFASNFIMVMLKMILLNLKIKSNLIQMYICWIKAWKSAILPVSVGLVYSFIFPHSIINNAIFVFIYGIILLMEFLYFPDLIGKEYKVSVYPKVKNIMNKLGLKM